MKLNLTETGTDEDRRPLQLATNMNTKSDDTIDRFIELRAQGVSFARIAEELNVHKTTLIAWSRKHADRIHNLRALEAETLAEQCRISRQALLEALAEDMQRLRAEIAKRPLDSIPAARLFSLAALLRSEAHKAHVPLKLVEPVPEVFSESECIPPPLVEWEG